MREYFQVKNNTGWTEPLDWVNINSVNDNEILLLVTEGTGIGFTVKVGTGTGTFSIDWGDGNIQTALIGNGTTVFQHQHTSGGAACSLGYNTWKVRIYNASGNITRWKVAFGNYTTNIQCAPILSANIGAQYITDYSNMFYKSDATVISNVLKKCVVKSFVSALQVSNMFNYCFALRSVTLPATWGSIFITYCMFANCYALQSVTLPASWGSVAQANSMFLKCHALQLVSLPSSWGSMSNVSSMFSDCYLIQSLTLPTLWGNVADTSSMFSSCRTLQFISLPASWGSVSNASQMFAYCQALQSIYIPTSWGSMSNVSQMFDGCTALYSVTIPTTSGNIANVSQMFNNCTSLKTINILNSLGSMTAQADFTNVLAQAEFLQQPILIGSLLSKIGIFGVSGKLLLCNSIRLTNSGSTFGGSSPQINISYTSLDAANLNLLFGDLPTLASKTINITGCPGAATCTRTIATAKGWTVTG